MKRPIKFLLENSLFLVLGAVGGLLWANVDHESYEHFLHVKLLENQWIGSVVHDDEHAEPSPSGEEVTEAEEDLRPTRVIDLHFLINDILMAVFFAIAAKEVWEATLPGGPLNTPRKAATPSPGCAPSRPLARPTSPSPV